MIKHVNGQYVHKMYVGFYILVPLVSEFAKARPDKSAIFVCIRHPSDRIKPMTHNDMTMCMTVCQVNV